MSFLHASLLPYQIRSRIKNNQAKRSSVPYQQARRIGILFTMTRLDDFEAIRKFEQKLKKENKEVEILSYLPKSVENFHFHYDIFQLSDFGLWGNLKSEHVKEFISRPFDYLICLDEQPNDYLRYVLAASQARLRIGPAGPDWSPIFDLTISPPGQGSVPQLIEQIIHYTSEFNG